MSNETDKMAMLNICTESLGDIANETIDDNVVAINCNTCLSFCRQYQGLLFGSRVCYSLTLFLPSPCVRSTIYMSESMAYLVLTSLIDSSPILYVISPLQVLHYSVSDHTDTSNLLWI